MWNYSSIKQIAIKAAVISAITWHSAANGMVAGDPPGLNQLAERANLVFKGEVVRVESRFAQPDAGSRRPAPYTFVTYKVEQTLKGGVTESEMTLRFAGGPYNDDEFILLDGLPLMDVGDRDVLFVQGNGEDPCPLVDCTSGRFREIDGFIVNELGQSIELTEDNQVKLGPALSLEQVQNHQLSKDIQITRYESELAEDYVSLDSFRETKPRHGFRPDPQGFLVLVKDAVEQAAAQTESEPKSERSLNPDEPFRDTFFAVAEAPAAPDVPVEEARVQQDEEGTAPAPAVAAARQPTALVPSARAPRTEPTAAAAAPVRTAETEAAAEGKGSVYSYGLVVFGPLAVLLWMLKRRRGR